jgi:hypothetical protein
MMGGRAMGVEWDFTVVGQYGPRLPEQSCNLRTDGPKVMEIGVIGFLGTHGFASFGFNFFICF